MGNTNGLNKQKMICIQWQIVKTLDAINFNKTSFRYITAKISAVFVWILRNEIEEKLTLDNQMNFPRLWIGDIDQGKGLVSDTGVIASVLGGDIAERDVVILHRIIRICFEITAKISGRRFFLALFIAVILYSRSNY